MFSLSTLMVLVPAMPLLAAVVVGAFGRWLLKEQSHVPVIIALGASFLFSLLLLDRVHAGADALAAQHASANATVNSTGDKQTESAAPVGYEYVHTLWTWADIDHAYTSTSPSTSGTDHSLKIDVTLRADPLTAIMLSMVTFISMLVAIYSKGYMHGDRGYWRFYAYVSLFVFSMTMLVSVSNFVLLYVFWEAVGACSYLLIGFWFQKPAAAAAGKKAFLVNRVGDFGFALAIFLIWTSYGTLNFHDTVTAGGVNVAGVLGQARLMGAMPFVAGGTGLAICLLLMMGAAGKSAQFPLHVWLPDAMEGPTPVSALIHAATMVTAGVYMVTRCTPLFTVSPTAQAVVATIGCITAAMAGVIALTQNDLKRVLAYSTVSQLGYMFLGLGTGTLAGIVAGMFHLFTHAFFKALLFLGAGSVMHAMGGVIDMRRFSGLRHIMPWTHRTFWCGALALAGVFPFAGFWSKDAIVAAVHARSEHDFIVPLYHGADGVVGIPLYSVLFIVALITALLTAFYTFRALFMTFFGPERVPPEAGHHAHESPFAMLLPLGILAVCSAVVGVVCEYGHAFADFLILTPSLAYSPLHAGEADPFAFHLSIAAISTVVALIGIGLAAFLYLGPRDEVDTVTRMAEGRDPRAFPPGVNFAYRFLALAPVRSLYHLSHGKFFFDEIYNAFIVWPLRGIAAACAWFDRNVVDGLVDLVGRLPRWLGSSLRSLQPGMVQFYALAMVLGLIVLVGSLLMWPAS